MANTKNSDIVYGCSPYSLEWTRKQITAYVHFYKTPRTRLDAVSELKDILGPHPHLRYLAACAHGDIERKRLQRRAAKKKAQENAEWWANGGRQQVYLRNHGMFGGDHGFLNKALRKETGMEIDLSECWDIFDDGDVTPAPRVEKLAKKCKYCGLRCCHEFEFGCQAKLDALDATREQPGYEGKWDMFPHLRRRIRSIIRRLSCMRANIVEGSDVYYVKKVKPDVTAMHQSDPDEHGEGDISVVKTSNVIVTEQHAASVSSEVPQPSNIKLVSGDIVNTFPSLSNRPYIIAVKTWSTGDDVDKLLYSASLPRDFICKAKSSPNVAPFKIHRYMRGDIVVRVQLNANKFMAGQLQIAWYYQPDLDKNFGDLRANCFSSSQTLHTLLNAGTSNEAILRIPYRYYKTLLETSQREDKELCLNMGKLYIRVLNKLNATSATSNACFFNVFVHLENCEFTGTIASNINQVPTADAEHEMDPASAILLTTALSKFSDANRDKPSTSAHPQYFSPQPAQSWCLGTNESENAYSLRLNHTLNPVRTDIASDLFTVSSIVKRYGLVSRKSWDSAKSSGSKLFSFPAIPMMRTQDYSTVSINNQTCYFLPPVSVMANLFQFFRGTLKLRLDFVATQMHTGRLLVAYVPGDHSDSLTLDDLYSSPYVEFDLKESQQLEFQIPFVSDKKYWPRTNNLDNPNLDLYAPGYVYIYVLNPLVCMDSISNSIDYNVYLAGGDDFELVVPAQSTVGLSFEVDTIQPSSDSFYRKGGYNDGFYVGTYHNLDINNKQYSVGQSFAINRWGIYAGHVVEYNYPADKRPVWAGTRAFGYYCTTSHKVSVRDTLANPPTRVDVEHWFPWMDDDRMYMLPMKSKALALEFVEKMLEFQGNYDAYFRSKDAKRPDAFFFPYPDDDADDYYDPSNSWKFTIVHVQKRANLTVSLHRLHEPDASHETGDNRTQTDTPTLAPTQSVPSTSSGGSIFGENFNDLKDLVRRYQPYAQVVFSGGELVGSKPGQVLFSFPVMPQGLALDIVNNKKNFFLNKCREGHIPLLLSGYRYFVGSVKFRVIVPNVNATYFVQHIPFRPLTKDVLTKSTAASLDSSVGMINHTYAYTVQSQMINSILSFEVPCYIPYDSILLQRNILKENKEIVKDYQTALSLGEIRIGSLQSIVKTEGASKIYTFDIAYSLGDDSQVSVFQGFPPMILVQDIHAHFEARVGAQHQMFSGLRSLAKSGRHVKRVAKELEGMKLTDTKNLADETLVKLGTSIEKTQEVLTNIDSFCSSGVETFQSFIDNLKQSGAPSFMVGAFGQIAQVINNPTPSVMAIAVCSFLISLGFITMQSMAGITEILTKLFTKLQPKQLNGVEAPATHQLLDQEDGVALASVLLAGISTALNTKSINSSKFTKGIAVDLLSGVTAGCKDGSYFFRFLSNVIATILKIFEHLKTKLFPTSFGVEHVLDGQEIVQKWLEEAVLLTDVSLEPFFEVVPTLADRVDACYIVGSLIMVKLASASRSVNLAAIRDLYNKICTLRTTLADKGKCSAIRREPFVIYMLGEPGIGKSQMSSKVILNLLREAKIPITSSPIYTHPAGAKYWENVNQEPAMLMDDAFVLRSGETFDSEISTMMSLKSSALFTPPIAECDRKKKRYAPELVYVHSNQAFPQLTNMQTAEAMYRRRDMLWEAAMIDGYKPQDITKFSTQQLNNCDHLRFRYHLDPRNPEKSNPWSKWFTYKQFFELTLEKFVMFRNKMIETHAAKIDLLNAAIREITAYPDLIQMPLIDTLKMYSKKNVFPDTSLYVEATNELIAKHESPNHFSQAEYIMKQLNRAHKPFERKFLETLMDETLLRGLRTLCKSDCTPMKYFELVPECVRVNQVQEVLSICTKSHICTDTIAYINARLTGSMTDRSYMLCVRGVVQGNAKMILNTLKKFNNKALVSDVWTKLSKQAPPKKPSQSGVPPLNTDAIELEELAKPPTPIPQHVDANVVVEENWDEVSSSDSELDDTDGVKELLESIQIQDNLIKESQAACQKVIKETVDKVKKFVMTDPEMDAHVASLGVSDDVVKYDYEKLNEIHDQLAHNICSSHLAQLITYLEIPALEDARRLLLGPNYKSIDYETRVKLYNKVFTKYGCPHFWVYHRTWTTELTTCCMKENNMPHFCASEQLHGCRASDGVCQANEAIPVSGEWCKADNCIVKAPLLQRIMRQCYIIEHPGTVLARADKDDGSVPPIIYEHKFSETIAGCKLIAEALYVNLKNYLVEFLKKCFGKLCKLYFWLKDHYKPICSFLGVCALLAGSFIVLKKKVPDHPVVTTTEHAAQSAGDAITSATTRFAATIKSKFRSSKKSDIILDSLPEDEDDSDVSPTTGAHQIIASGDVKGSARAARTVFKAKQLSNASAINPSASHQMAHDEVVATRIIDNTIHLIAMHTTETGAPDETTSSVARALALGDRYVLTVRHALERWQYLGMKVVRCLVKDRQCDINLVDIKYTPLDDSSLIVFRMPANFPQFKKIINFFASESDHMYRCPSEGLVISCGTFVKLIDCKIEIRSTPLVIDGLVGAEQVTIAGLYQYQAQSPGMCGSLLLGPQLNSPIIGMHIAGNKQSGIGYAEPLFKETFQSLFSGLITSVVEPVFFPHESAKIDLQSTVFPVGCIGKQMAHHSPSETAIHNSLIHGYVPPKSEPAPLSEKDPRLPPNSSPLIKGCEKHGIVTKNFPPDVLSRTQERLRNHLFAQCKPHRAVRPLKLTDEQAICGDPQLAYCDPIRWNSSEGYPFFKFRPPGVSDKKWLFKLNETPQGLKFEGYSDLLGNIIEYKRKERECGVQQPTIFVDCLKDARISKEKVSTPGKTRIFSMSPVDYTIDFRRYFYDFISTYQTKRMQNFNSIGINVFSTEWDVLARALLRHPNICTGDYSNFGPGLNLEVARLCLDIILEWYTEFDETETLEDKRTRACLAAELVGSLHLCHDLVYRVVAGIPSGSPITAVLNSLINTFYLFAAWDMLSETWPLELQNFENFNKHIVLSTYGDDFIFSVSNQYRDYYNSYILSKLFAKFDIKLTDAFKGAEVTPYSTIKESSFLKGAFVFFHGRWWYGLDKDQVYDMVNFINSKYNIEELTRVNADAALIHAHGHGESFFDRVKAKLVRAFRARGVVFHGRTFKEITTLKTQDAESQEIKNLLKKLLPIF
ncbi:polyprotein [Recilia dorsalis iflavirus 2]|nr:polyprotein [Recilia dorsalis iflavirus 2]